MRVDPTTLLATLDAAGAAPDWVRYPIGRDYFVQERRWS